MYITSDLQAFAHYPLIDAQFTPWALKESEMNSHPLSKLLLHDVVWHGWPKASLSQLY